jgi:pimeloyl-ACP methyl ester carboxylesterase
VLVTSTGGISLTVHDLGGEGPPLLLSHATGFHGCAYTPMAAHLRRRFHCWALDYRGHGDSDPPPDDVVAWPVFGDDALAVAEALELRGAMGFGHSMGGATLLMAELARPGTFAGLVLFEPIAFPPEPVDEGRIAEIAGAARRRREVFASRDEAYANYASKPPLNVMVPDALRAYVEHGFVDQPGGSVRLRCDPEHEAAIFEAGAQQDTYDRLGAVDCPVVVAAGSAARNMPGALAPAVAAALPHGRFVRFEDLTHFGPMQDPGRVAGLVSDLADELGVG